MLSRFSPFFSDVLPAMTHALNVELEVEHSCAPAQPPIAFD